MHDDRYFEHGQTIPLTALGMFSDKSAPYKLTMYPSDELFEVYSTHNPFIATVGAVCCIIFTSLLFFLFDFFVRQEFSAKRNALEAKRQFVRFVSHEVRTPLNTVCMGLRLMQEEIEGGLLDAKNCLKGGAVMGQETVAATTTSTAVNGESTPERSEKEQQFLDLSREIVSGADSAVDVLNDLLNYDKIEIGCLSLDNTVIPYWDLIRRTTAEFQLPAMAKNIDFVLKYSPVIDSSIGDKGAVDPVTSAANLPMDFMCHRVIGDSIRLTQVLRNLFSNALKFTPEGGKIYDHRDERVRSVS